MLLQRRPPKNSELSFASIATGLAIFFQETQCNVASFSFVEKNTANAVRTFIIRPVRPMGYLEAFGK